MPARLVISAGSGHPTSEVWIERPFLKVGAGGDADVRIQPTGGPLADVAVYVQFRNSRYEVFNKECDEAVLGGRRIVRGESSPWSPHERLELGAGVRLDLVVDDDPSPRPRAVGRRVSQPDAPVHAAPQAAAALNAHAATGRPPAGSARLNGRQILQLGVTAACVLACVLMMVVKQGGGTVVGGRQGDVFERLVAEGLAASGSDAALRNRLSTRLQAAEAAHLAGDSAAALARYEQIKRWLDPHRDARPQTADAASAEADFFQRLAAFVDSRVAALTTTSRSR